ncbi:hypothetical protein LTR37_005922 [Vermiconidia calcicola]|uniref:Uncharacterized protein n=1 Tax=Vermiconidia calcicola TaxID=1690605 RepID=A0ACC3NHY5_9PEZI|nr:hypothetical protein LTR37_005922 [Vermiconidia calcicola]
MKQALSSDSVDEQRGQRKAQGEFAQQIRGMVKSILECSEQEGETTARSLDETARGILLDRGSASFESDKNLEQPDRDDYAFAGHNPVAEEVSEDRSV